MNRYSLLKTLVFAAALALVLAAALGEAIPAGAKIFVEDMDNDFDAYIRAEIVKQKKLRLSLVGSAEAAQYVLRGSSSQGKKLGVGERIFGSARDTYTAAVDLVSTADEAIVWSFSAGDKAAAFAIEFNRKGPKRVARRIVDNLRKAVNR